MKNQRKLHVINEQETCFSNCINNDLDCKESSCKNWINCNEYNNCTIIACEYNEKISIDKLSKILSISRTEIQKIEKKLIRLFQQ